MAIVQGSLEGMVRLLIFRPFRILSSIKSLLEMADKVWAFPTAGMPVAKVWSRFSLESA